MAECEFRKELRDGIGYCENPALDDLIERNEKLCEENARLRTQNANLAEAAGELAEILYGMIGHPIYRYKGWIFEAPERSEPWPLTAELSPKANAGAKFWDMYDEWKALPIAERESYRIKC